MHVKEYTNKYKYDILANKNFNKIFNIGYNKTGTTSMEYIFQKLGYLCPNQQEQEARIVKQMYLGNFKPLIEFVDKYDAFQDMPFSQEVVYSQVDALFPNSKFILTIRDKDSWYDSLVRFQTNGMLKKAGIHDIKDASELTFKDKNLYLYNNYIYENKKRQISQVKNYKIQHNWSLLYSEEHLTHLYEDRNNQIIKYFQNRPNDLLIIDIQKEKDISKILSFLNLPENLNFDLPHLNKTK